jgi:hypothetical protein
MTLYSETSDPIGGLGQRITLVAVVVLLSSALLWPAMLNGGPLIFFDTLQYLDQGRGGYELIIGKVGAVFGTAGSTVGAGATAAVEEVSFVRSLAYPVFAYVGTLGPLGFSGTAFLQSMVVVVLLILITGREALARPIPAAIAATLFIAFTSLPWTVSTLMPDVFAAVAILCAIIIAARLDRLGWGGKLFVFCAASFAALMHYGHLPLYFLTAGAALLVLAIQWRLRVSAVVLAVGPLVATLVASLGVSAVVFDEPGIVPLRLPLLLVRSIEDGPARWHLEKHCDEYGYAICDLWEGEIPHGVGTLLWSKDSMLRTATDSQMDRIRKEEFLILKRAFLEFPAEQTWSLVGNAARQMGLIGLGDTSWGRVVDGQQGEFVREAAATRSDKTLEFFDSVQKIIVLLSIGLIVLFIARDRLRVGDQERSALFVAVVGLMANAAIFGGLSVPVDRYQMRVIWILPMLAALFCIARRRTAHDDRARDA